MCAVPLPLLLKTCRGQLSAAIVPCLDRNAWAPAHGCAIPYCVVRRAGQAQSMQVKQGVCATPRSGACIVDVRALPTTIGWLPDTRITDMQRLSANCLPRIGWTDPYASVNWTSQGANASLTRGGADVW